MRAPRARHPHRAFPSLRGTSLHLPSKNPLVPRLNIQRILFPTDFSDGARAAFPQAVFLADWHDATLHVLNVIEDSSPEPEEAPPAVPMPADTLADWLGPSANEASMPDLESLSLAQDQVESSSPPERIVAYAEQS